MFVYYCLSIYDSFSFFCVFLFNSNHMQTTCECQFFLSIIHVACDFARLWWNPASRSAKSAVADSHNLRIIPAKKRGLKSTEAASRHEDKWKYAFEI